VNRLLAGSNVQWVDRGDELLEGDGSKLSADMLSKVKALGPTVLRYPGGAQADTYRWKDGVGPLDARKTGEHFFSRAPQKILFGTTELLALCREVGAEPLLTVNVVRGSPEEAAEWVTFTNAIRVKGPNGERPPAASLWEIGNEPYLKESRPDLALPPREFARRAAAFIVAMKKADPTIRVGIPLRSDRIGGQVATHFPGYNDIVLQELGAADYDFVAVHDAYLPFLFGAAPPREALLGAALAGDAVIEEDFAATRAQVERHRPGRPVSLAVTEYGAMFTQSGAPTDRYNASLTAALYAADVLRLLAERDDVLLAAQWSLSGNGWFGLISNRGRLRPAYYVLREFARLARGGRLRLDLDGPRQDTPAAGLVPAQKARPVITAFGARQGRTLRVMLLNKDVQNPASVLLAADVRVPLASAKQGELWTEDYLGDPDSGPDPWSERALAATQLPLTVELKPHSVSFLELQHAP
jgi:alpha-N-arabinofuranosidase